MPLFGPPNVEKLKAKRNVKGLVKALGYKKGDWTVRRVREAAAEALGEIGDVRAVKPLIATLKDENEEWEVRKAVAKALGQIGDTRVVKSLIATLEDEQEDVRRAAVKALVEIGAPAVEPLIAALKDRKEDVRRAAVKALIEIGAPAVEPLIAALKDKVVREAAAGVLDNLGWQPDRSEIGAMYWIAKSQWYRCVEIGALAVEPLITALKDENWGVRWGAAGALGQIGDTRAVEPLVAALKDKREDVRWAAARALDKLGWQPDSSETEGAFWAAMREWDLCIEIGAPAVGPLIAALKDENRGVRRGAAEALGQIGDGRAVEPLIAALKDRKEDVRRAAVKALIEIGAPAVEPLIAALKDKVVREAAAGVLDNLGWQPDRSEIGAMYWIAKSQWYRCVEIGALAVEPLIAALKDRKEDVRRAAVKALIEIGAPALESLIAALKDENWDVHRAATKALVEIGTPAVEPLIAALKAEDKVVREAAAEVLDKLGWQPDRNEIGATYWIVKGQLYRCVEIGAPAVEPLIQALGDENWDVRSQAVGALEKLGEAAVEPLITALNLKDNGENVWLEEVEVLLRIGTPEALDAVKKWRGRRPWKLSDQELRQDRYDSGY